MGPRPTPARRMRGSGRGPSNQELILPNTKVRAQNGGPLGIANTCPRLHRTSMIATNSVGRSCYFDPSMIWKCYRVS